MRGTPIFKPCVVIPFYNHGHALRKQVERIRGFKLPMYVVDDGSERSSADEAESAVREYGVNPATLINLRNNQGKGVAVIAGLRAAAFDGYTHAIQVDADGQHDVNDIPAMLEIASSEPSALVTGVPKYDQSVPRCRLYGRYVTHVWVWIHTWSFEIRDSMCGFRVYPLAETLSVCNKQNIGRRMDFDTDIMVRMFWSGVRVRSIPTRVTYPLDGISHFNLLNDNIRISWMHARLFMNMLWRMPLLIIRRAFSNGV